MFILQKIHTSLLQRNVGGCVCDGGGSRDSSTACRRFLQYPVLYIQQDFTACHSCTKESEIVRISRNNSIFVMFGEAHFYILKGFCCCSIISFSFYKKYSWKEYQKKLGVYFLDPHTRSNITRTFPDAILRSYLLNFYMNKIFILQKLFLLSMRVNLLNTKQWLP